LTFNDVNSKNILIRILIHENIGDDTDKS